MPEVISARVRPHLRSPSPREPTHDSPLSEWRRIDRMQRGTGCVSKRLRQPVDHSITPSNATDGVERTTSTLDGRVACTDHSHRLAWGQNLCPISPDGPGPPARVAHDRKRHNVAAHVVPELTSRESTRRPLRITVPLARISGDCSVSGVAGLIRVGPWILAGPPRTARSRRTGSSR